MKRQKSCKKHPDVAYTTYRCPVCQAAYYKASAEERKAYSAAYRKANLDKLKAVRAAYRKNNPEKVKAADAAYRKANPEKCGAKYAKYKKANPEKVRANNAAYYKANPEKSKAANAAWVKANPEKNSAKSVAWQKANPEKHNANHAMRRATKLQATPAWADDFIMKEAYHLAQLRSKMLGFKWHVDHIVPLKSKIVCGLHCEANLRVIPGAANMLKSNRHWPDMPV